VVAKVARGVTDYLLSPISIAGAYLEAGTLVALGVSSARRSPWLPDVPTVAEKGIDGFDFPIWYGAWVRAGTCADIVQALGNDFCDAMASCELQDGSPNVNPRRQRATNALKSLGPAGVRAAERAGFRVHCTLPAEPEPVS
jgi:tripartite-type tricarboxylate transporter receptor subunit TctC